MNVWILKLRRSTCLQVFCLVYCIVVHPPIEQPTRALYSCLRVFDVYTCSVLINFDVIHTCVSKIATRLWPQQLQYSSHILHWIRMLPAKNTASFAKLTQCYDWSRHYVGLPMSIVRPVCRHLAIVSATFFCKVFIISSLRNQALFWSVVRFFMSLINVMYTRTSSWRCAWMMSKWFSNSLIVLHQFRPQSFWFFISVSIIAVTTWWWLISCRVSTCCSVIYAVTFLNCVVSWWFIQW